MVQTVIVDELLCFISSKLDYVSCDELVSLCINAFSDIVIKKSKVTLFKTCQRGPDDPVPMTGIKYRACKGPHRMENNVKDMLALFQELGDTAPPFAAVNLNILPTVSADKVDVTSLVNMINKLTADVSFMSKAMNRQNELIVTLQNAVTNVHKTLDDIPVVTYADKAKSADNNSKHSTPQRRSSSVDPEATSGPSTTPVNEENEVWNEVAPPRRPRRNKRLFKTGQVPNTANHAPDLVGIKRVKRAELFETRLSPNCTEDELKSFIMSNLELDATVTKINNARNAEYFSSFHISCECSDPRVFYNENLWPQHVLYRGWSPPRTSRNIGDTVLPVNL